MPDGFFVTADGRTSYLTYATAIWGSQLTTGGCVFLMVLSGTAGGCPQGQSVEWQCAMLRFDAARRLNSVAFREIGGTKCTDEGELDKQLQPAIRQPIDTFIDVWV